MTPAAGGYPAPLSAYSQPSPVAGEVVAGIRRDKLDAIFSALVRERANQLCEDTGYDGTTCQLECCHVVGRRNRAVRWHPLNAFSLSHARHRFYTENPLDFTAFVERKIGREGMIELHDLARTITNWTPRQLEGLYKHYCNEYARLVNARENGRMGRIEFFWPDPMPEAEPKPKRKAKKSSLAKAKKKIAGKPFSKKYKRKINGTTVRRNAA